MKTLIGYARVSTEDQGSARNGLEAQMASITKFAADNGYKLLEIVQEVASGKLGLNDRPVLAQAIARAVKLKAVVVVSKLDRLSRHAAFVLNLMETKVKFIVSELGEAVDSFMLHIYAVVGQKERELISERTRSALAQLKLKGVQLGNRTNAAEASAAGGAAYAAKADAFAERMRSTLVMMKKTGMSHSAIARQLNENGTTTARGGAWGTTTVSNMVARLGIV